MKTAKVKWVDGEQFVGEGPSGHGLVVDSDRERNTGPGPMELLLVALGACTATDVVEILRKKRQKLKGLEVAVSGDRAQEPPRVWRTLEIVYRLRGENATGETLDEKAVKDAIELSESKYCSVAAMLGKTAKISFRWEISRG